MKINFKTGETLWTTPSGRETWAARQRCWRAWFAWHPARICAGVYLWGEWIDRRRSARFPWRWEYKEFTTVYWQEGEKYDNRIPPPTNKSQGNR